MIRFLAKTICYSINKNSLKKIKIININGLARRAPQTKRALRPAMSIFVTDALIT